MNDKLYLCLVMAERPLSEGVHLDLTRLTNQGILSQYFISAVHVH